MNKRSETSPSRETKLFPIRKPGSHEPLKSNMAAITLARHGRIACLAPPSGRVGDAHQAALSGKAVLSCRAARAAVDIERHAACLREAPPSRRSPGSAARAGGCGRRTAHTTSERRSNSVGFALKIATSGAAASACHRRSPVSRHSARQITVRHSHAESECRCCVCESSIGMSD